MNWYREYEADLIWVFTEAEAIISEFPQPLNTTGLAYLNKFNVLKEGSTNNYICYLLPFWMMDFLPIDRVICRHLSLANVLGMLYFFIQDDRMDSISLYNKYQLPLANLLHIKFLKCYQQLFTTDSLFWTFYSKYITEWAEAVTNENHEHSFLKDPLLIARKASPMKLCSTGACLLMEREELIPIISDFVDHVLTTLQMADDWVDWQEDLHEGNYNSLIDFIAAHYPIKYGQDMNESIIKEAIYTRAQLTPYVQAAVEHHKHLATSCINVPHLLSFHEYMVHNLLEEASTIIKKRDSLALGGFEWLMENMKE